MLEKLEKFETEKEELETKLNALWFKDNITRRKFDAEKKHYELKKE